MFKKIEQFDTSQKELNGVNYEVTKSILDILNESTSESICYLSYNELDKSLPNYFLYSEVFSLRSSVNFGARPLVEADNDKVQPLPILVITNKERNKVFVVKKNKRLTSEHSPTFRLDSNEFITKGNTKSGKVFEIKDIYKQYNELVPCPISSASAYGNLSILS